MSTPIPIEIPPGFWQREASHVPKPLSPLFRSLLPVANDGFRRMFSEMGVLPEGLEWREIGGWVYTRVIPPGGKDRRPPPRPLLPLLVRLVPALRRSVSRATDAVRSDRFGGHLECWHGLWRPELVARIGGLRVVDLASLDDRALGGHLQDVMELTRRAWDTHFLLHGVNAYILADLAFTCRDLLGWTDAQALELVSGLSEASTAPAARIAALAAMARERPAVRRLLEGDVDAPGVGIKALEAADAEFAVAFCDYQSEFGFRAIRYEVADATAEEQPTFALRLIADQLRSGFDPATLMAAARDRRESALAEARQALAQRPEADRARFERALRRAERFYPVREDNAPMTKDRSRKPMALAVGQGSGRGEAPEVIVRPSDQNGFVSYRSTNKTVYSAKYHLIWCPKYRRNVLVSGVDEEILGQVGGEVGAEIIEIEVMPDHVHLLVEIPPPVALSRFVQLAKGRSSSVLRQEFPRLRRFPCLWSPSWFVSTVGGAPLEVVRRYVENQKRVA